LQDKRDDIASDEDEGIGPWLEVSEGWAVEEDEAGEVEVDCCRKEAGGDREADEVPMNRKERLVCRGKELSRDKKYHYIHEEPVKVKDIVMHCNTGDVAQHFQDRPAEHGGHVGPSVIVDPQTCLHEPKRGKPGEVERVAR